MKEIIKNMDRAFDSRVRLAIMALLQKEDWIDFNEMKLRLGVTDGNLASHMASLEKKKFVEVNKQFINKRPNTSYKITAVGKAAFEQYLIALKKLLHLK